jgi:hypothetical protein
MQAKEGLAGGLIHYVGQSFDLAPSWLILLPRVGTAWRPDIVHSPCYEHIYNGRQESKQKPVRKTGWEWPFR